MTAMTELEREIGERIIGALNLEHAVATIDPDAPLYGEALGLDSIDILEIAVVVSKEYGIEFQSESAGDAKIFGSLRALALFVAENRTR